jgi:hypothetical protein
LAAAIPARFSAVEAEANAAPDAPAGAASRELSDRLSAAAAKPYFRVNNFALEIEGVPSGLLRSFSGGQASAEVVRDEPGRDCFVRKSLARGVNYTDLVFSVAGIPGPEVMSWVYEALSCGSGGRSGAIVSLDVNNKQIRRLEFKNAVITEVTLPPLDSNDAKTAFSLTLRCHPDATQIQPGSRETFPLPKANALKGSTSNFLVTLDGGLEKTLIDRVGSLTLKRKEIRAELDNAPLGLLGPVDVADFEMEFLENNSEALYEWHQRFVVEGKNGPEWERNATIELLAPNLKSTLGAIQLSGLGIYSLEPPTGESAKEVRPNVIARLYCQEARLKL